MRGLVKRQDGGQAGELGKQPVALGVPAREEAPEVERLACEPRRRDRAGHRRGPGDHVDRDARVEACVDEPRPRIRHRGHAGVGDERDALARQHALHQLRGAPGDHVLVAALEAALDPEGGQQPAGDARVLGAHDVGGAQGVRRAR